MRGVTAAAAIFAGVFAFIPSAVAKPPVLVSVGHVNWHPTATWTEPDGVDARFVEVATDLATRPDGSFLDENVTNSGELPTGTTWVDNDLIEPGVYYVHIYGTDELCYLNGFCPFLEYSQPMRLVIPPWPPLPASCRVPNLIGLRLAIAKTRIRQAHCSVGLVKRRGSRRVGRVLYQRPYPVWIKPRGYPVTLVVGRK